MKPEAIVLIALIVSTILLIASVILLLLVLESPPRPRYVRTSLSRRGTQDTPVSPVSEFPITEPGTPSTNSIRVVGSETFARSTVALRDANIGNPAGDTGALETSTRAAPTTRAPSDHQPAFC